MFRGNFQIAMDAKGRLAVPKKYRDRIAEQCGVVEKHGLRMVMTLGESEDCLVVYPLKAWEGIEEGLNEHPALQSDAESEARARAEWTCRFVIGNATDCELDSHGRLLVPPALRAHARLEKQVRVVGWRDKFELWDESHWNARSAEEYARNKDTVRQARSDWRAGAESA